MEKPAKTKYRLPPLPTKRPQPDPISEIEFVLLEAKKLREHWFVDGAWQNLSGAAFVFFKEHFEKTIFKNYQCLRRCNKIYSELLYSRNPKKEKDNGKES